MIRLGNEKDLKEILLIISDAQNRLKELNVDQWQDGYPNEYVIRKDINNKELFVYCFNDEVIGTMSVLDYEPTYDNIKGKWLNDKDYIAVHRIAIKDGFHGKGIGKEMLLYAINYFEKDLKIDTHPDNIPMQKMLRKLNFIYCGDTYIGPKDNDLRYCYQKEYQND